MLLTLLIFIIVLGLLVFVHELGHFVVAKRSGMQVDEFGFGFPPRIFGVQKKQGKWALVAGPKKQEGTETVYSINLIPLGGFVKILGENGDSESDPNSFSKKPFFPRLFTLIAGVIMNVVLAWVLISIGFAVGVPTSVGDSPEFTLGGKIDNQSVTIVGVDKDGPAQRAGIEVGDRMLEVGGKEISSPKEMQDRIAEIAGEKVEFVVERSGQIISLEIDSVKQTEEGKGSTGVVISLVGDLKYPFYSAPIIGAKYTWLGLTEIVKGIVSIFTGDIGVDQLGGPVKIAQMTGDATRLGVLYLLQFTAFLSLNLAVLNSLPFPALDGGRVLFLLIEKVRRRPNNRNFEQVVNVVGFFLLLLLMLVVTLNDLGGFGKLVSKVF